MDPTNISFFRPIRSIKYRPKRVKIKFVIPIPILLNKAELSFSPAISKIQGA